MVPLHMAGFPGKHKGSLSNFTAPILTAATDVIYPVLMTANAEVPTVFILVNILPIFSAFPNHVGINIGDSLHSTNSNVFSRQQTCHQRNPKHYILRIWNCYIVADHVWCQVSFACKNDLISKETVMLPRRESQTLKFRVNADINNQLKKDHKLTFGPLALRESEWFKSVASDRCIIPTGLSFFQFRFSKQVFPQNPEDISCFFCLSGFQLFKGEVPWLSLAQLFPYCPCRSGDAQT